MRSLRATATMPIRRWRGPPLAKRVRYQRVRALVGCRRTQLHASSMASARMSVLPALLIPSSCDTAPHVATRPGRRREAGERGDLAAVVELPPREELRRVEPRAHVADPAEGAQARDHAAHRISGRVGRGEGVGPLA